jgi:predicted ATP-dependent protease
VSLSPAIFHPFAAGPTDVPTDVEVAFLRDELEGRLRSRREQEASLVERVVADGDPVARAHLVHVRDVVGAVRDDGGGAGGRPCSTTTACRTGRPAGCRR